MYINGVYWWWLHACTHVIELNRTQYTHSVLFLIAAHGSIIISIKKVTNKRVPLLSWKYNRIFQGFLFGSTLPLAECKYQFQAWGECDLNTALKTRTGSLKRALHNAECQKTVTISKPCGKLTKPKPQGKSLPLYHNFNGLMDSGKIWKTHIFQKELLGELPEESDWKSPLHWEPQKYFKAGSLWVQIEVLCINEGIGTVS